MQNKFSKYIMFRDLHFQLARSHWSDSIVTLVLKCRSFMEFSLRNLKLVGINVGLYIVKCQREAINSCLQFGFKLRELGLMWYCFLKLNSLKSQNYKTLENLATHMFDIFRLTSWKWCIYFDLLNMVSTFKPVHKVRI